MNNLKRLTEEEIQVLKSVGKIAENWYAISYSQNELPYAIFREELHAIAYKNQFSATSIVEPWPMLVKDFSKATV